MSDNDAELLERRSKSVITISVLFLVYIFGGGELGNEISVLGSGITFSNPWVLKIFALLYFMNVGYRYFLVNKNPYEAFIISVFRVYAQLSDNEHDQIEREIYIHSLNLKETNILFEKAIKTRNFVIRKIEVEGVSTIFPVIDAHYEFLNNRDIPNNIYTVPITGLLRFKMSIKRIVKYVLLNDNSFHFFYPPVIYSITTGVIIWKIFSDLFSIA